jgi:hypothetical protein
MAVPMAAVELARSLTRSLWTILELEGTIASRRRDARRRSD